MNYNGLKKRLIVIFFQLLISVGLRAGLQVSVDSLICCHFNFCGEKKGYRIEMTNYTSSDFLLFFDSIPKKDETLQLKSFFGQRVGDFRLINLVLDPDLEFDQTKVFYKETFMKRIRAGCSFTIIFITNKDMKEVLHNIITIDMIKVENFLGVHLRDRLFYKFPEIVLFE